MSTRPPCKSCGGPTVPRRTRNGYCDPCSQRWYRAGKPDTGPPPAQPRGFTEASRALSHATIAATLESNLRWYAQLKARDLPIKAIVARMGVSKTTVCSYGKRLRERQANQ